MKVDIMELLALIAQGLIALGTIIIALVAMFPRRFANTVNRIGDIQNTITINSPDHKHNEPPLSMKEKLTKAQLLCPHIQYEVPDEIEIRNEGTILKLNSLFHTYPGTILYFCHVCNLAATKEKAEFSAMQWYKRYDENNPIESTKAITKDIDEQWKKYDNFTKKLTDD